MNHYMRAVNPQGVPRIAEREEAKYIGFLNLATAQESYEIVLRRIWKEVQMSKQAVFETSQGRTPGNIKEPFPGDIGGGMPSGGAPGGCGGGGEAPWRRRLPH